MKADDMIKLIKYLKYLSDTEIAEEKGHGAVGQKCIVRTYASGVHFGEVVSVAGNGGRSRCELKNARRLWRWCGGLSLSEIAVNGIVQKDSKICTLVVQHFIEDAIEFIPCSYGSIESIEEAEDYE